MPGRRSASPVKLTQEKVRRCEQEAATYPNMNLTQKVQTKIRAMQPSNKDENRVVHHRQLR